MRISTNTMYQSGISKISDMQASQVKLQTQISTGKRIQSPSDDPIASARALNTQQAQNINSQFASNSLSLLPASARILSTLSKLDFKLPVSVVRPAVSAVRVAVLVTGVFNKVTKLVSVVNISFPPP